MVMLTTRARVDSRQVSAAVRALVESGIVASGDVFGSVRLKTTTYAFGTLNGWKKSLERGFFALSGSVVSDLDEKTDRIVLGYDPAVLPKSRVQALVRRSGVPADAVRLQATDPPVLDSLHSRSPVAAGGLQVYDLPAGKYCSLGFVARRAGVRGFVTDSHCTRTFGAVDSDSFYQPDLGGGPASFAGTETVDPPLIPRGVGECPGILPNSCRYSDAAFIDITHTSWLTGPGAVASMSALGSYAAWDGVSFDRIQGEGSRLAGRAVFKVGAATGKTQGNITYVCATITISRVILLCTDEASYGAAASDSGAPVLGYVGAAGINADVNLYGTHIGNLGSLGMYSAIQYIETEVGSLEYRYGH